MYQALYRKWRPFDFDAVYGQEQTVRLLKAQAASGRISHAYLLCGTRGTGKTTVAKILAKAVNCLDQKDGNPCNKCSSCVSINDGSNVDVVEIDAASNTGVDNIRDIRDETFYTPAMSKYRVYIIDEAHMLSMAAFNALLKTLEEPPSHVIFILATTDRGKLPSTILSRCQRFDFKPLRQELIEARLSEVCQGEGISAEPAAISLIARLADGALRDALSILDQCASVSKSISYDDVARLMGTGEREYLQPLLCAIAEKDFGAALKVSARLAESGKPFSAASDELLCAFRDLLVIKTVNGCEPLLQSSPDQFKTLFKAAEDFSVSRLFSLSETVLEAKETLTRGGGKKTDFEIMLFCLCSPEAAGGTGALEERLCRLERAVVSGNFAGVTPDRPAQKKPPSEKTEKAEITEIIETTEKAETTQKAEKKADAARKPEPAREKSASASGSIEFWAELLAKTEPSLRAALAMCKPSLSENSFIITAPGLSYRILSSPAATAAVSATLRLVSGGSYEVVIREQGAAREGDPFKSFVESAGSSFKVID